MPQADPTPAEAARWNRLAGKYAVRTYRNTAFMPWWEALNKELAERGLPEALYREAKDAWEFGQSPETEAAEHEARRAC